MNIRTELSVSSRNIFAIIITIIAINVFLLAGTFVFNATHIQALRETDLASENVFAAWYSSMLLLLSTVTSLFCFFIDRQRNRNHKGVWNFGWLIYATAFALLSFDELGSIHEHIGNFSSFKRAGHLVTDANESGWLFFYFLVFIVSLFMLLFSVKKLRKVKWALPLLILALLLYLSNPVQEYFEVESMRAHAGNDTWKRPIYFLLLEEGSELFGSLFFLLAIVLYARDHLFVKETRQDLVMRLIVFISFVAAACLLVINVLFGDVKGDVQDGVPKNWITAASAFLVSTYCFLIYKYHKISSYLLFGIFSLCLSVYFGSNRFAWYFTADYSSDRMILKSCLSAVGVFSYLFLVRNFYGIGVKMMSAIFLIIVIAGIYIKRKYSAEMVFTGVSCFAVLLVAETIRLTEANKKLARSV